MGVNHMVTAGDGGFIWNGLNECETDDRSLRGRSWLQVQGRPDPPRPENRCHDRLGPGTWHISPFGVRSGQDAGTFTLPVPADAIRNGRLFVPLSITQFGAPPHTPTAEEVRSVRETDRPRRAALSAGRRFTFLGAVNRRV
jgi:hypothetical protein